MSITAISLAQQDLFLQQVSRTFALTIPLMGATLHDCIGNAYLLCRLADTIEDDAIASVCDKRQWLLDFAALALAVADDSLSLEQIESLLYALRDKGTNLVRQGAKSAELRLMQSLPEVIAKTLGYEVAVKKIIFRTVSIMCLGMTQSLGQSIDEISDLQRYCYFVAGVVGEMLALLFAYYDKNADAKSLLNLSVSFGQGLQLTNILKDRAEDKKRAVCFVPAYYKKSDLLNLTASSLGNIADAFDFTLRLPKSSLGVRKFCLLNLMLAIATLRRISENPLGSSQELKISRWQVRILALVSLFCSRFNLASRFLYKIMVQKLRVVRADPVALRQDYSWWDKDIKAILQQQRALLNEENYDAK